MKNNNQDRHLELMNHNGNFFIQINSMVGRLSLFADHPLYKLSAAMDMNNRQHQTAGKLSLVQTRKKDLFILEDADESGNKIQNFVYVADDLSRTMSIQVYSKWLREHLVDFFTRSISVTFFLLYIIYYFTVMRYYNTVNTLYVLRYITGIITLVFALAFYYLRSCHSKSSFLKFCFKIELVAFVFTGTISNIYHLIYLSSATDTF